MLTPKVPNGNREPELFCIHPDIEKRSIAPKNPPMPTDSKTPQFIIAVQTANHHEFLYQTLQFFVEVADL